MNALLNVVLVLSGVAPLPVPVDVVDHPEAVAVISPCAKHLGVAGYLMDDASVTVVCKDGRVVKFLKV